VRDVTLDICATSAIDQLMARRYGLTLRQLQIHDQRRCGRIGGGAVDNRSKPGGNDGLSVDIRKAWKES